MVRPGAALFGVNPTPGRRNPMRPVVGLQAQGRAGAHRAKGGDRRLQRHLDRKARNAASLWSRSAMPTAIRGPRARPTPRRAPMPSLAERVARSPDAFRWILLAVDITALPDHTVRRGDLVTLHWRRDRRGRACGGRRHHRLRGTHKPRQPLSPGLPDGSSAAPNPLQISDFLKMFLYCSYRRSSVQKLRFGRFRHVADAA